MLTHGGTLLRGQFIEIKCYANVNPIRQAKYNPILDSRHYMVKFENGEVTELTENIIDESIYYMCDLEGEHVILLYCIVDFNHDRSAMAISEQNFVESRGKAQNYMSTKGWKLCCQWKDVSMSWENIYDFNNFYPGRADEYAIVQVIYYESAFRLWARHTLKAHESIIYIVHKRYTIYLKKDHKFGI